MVNLANQGVNVLDSTRRVGIRGCVVGEVAQESGEGAQGLAEPGAQVLHLIVAATAGGVEGVDAKVLVEFSSLGNARDAMSNVHGNARVKQVQKIRVRTI